MTTGFLLTNSTMILAVLQFCMYVQKQLYGATVTPKYSFLVFFCLFKFLACKCKLTVFIFYMIVFSVIVLSLVLRTVLKHLLSAKHLFLYMSVVSCQNLHWFGFTSGRASSEKFLYSCVSSFWRGLISSFERDLGNLNNLFARWTKIGKGRWVNAWAEMRLLNRRNCIGRDDRAKLNPPHYFTK